MTVPKLHFDLPNSQIERKNPKAATALKEDYVLYRFFDKDEMLLYVGITMNPVGRFKNHRWSKPWWTAISRISMEHFASVDEVKTAERNAIKSEHPIWNVIFNNIKVN